MVIDYNLRIDTTKKYLEKLQTNFSKNWNILYQEYLDGSLDELDKLTLLHPDFIRRLHLPEYISQEHLINEIQGKRSFDYESGVCQSQLLWGYNCTFASANCHGDHLFPYSLGGPTIGANKLLLCRYHNMVKGTDIHLFPWNEATTRLTWIDSQIRKTYNLVSLYIKN